MTGVVPAGVPHDGPVARILAVAARQRELSLVAVMLAMGVFVAFQAPQFLSAGNLTDVTVLASIIAIAAVGEAMVVITRNVDLSVEAVIGLVAFVVADLLSGQVLPTPMAMAAGVGLGLTLGMINGLTVAVLRVPSIVATLGTLSIYRGIDFLIAGGKQVTLNPTALKILSCLMESSPAVVTRQELETRVWGEELPDSDSLRVHIHGLRAAVDKPFGKPLIQTRHGIGYRIADPEPAA